MALTVKQQLFAEEYLIDGNATQAAIRAGYSKRTAASIGSENLRKPQIDAYIQSRIREKKEKLTAKQDEVLEYITSVMRGESESEVIVVESEGEGYSKAKAIMKHPDEKERLKAAELMGRRYNLFKDSVDLNGTLPVVIRDDVDS